MFEFIKNKMYNGKRFSVYGLGIILLLTLAVRFASPIKDGDFFWHAEYGKYMLEHGTLIPDHTIYSWTPADNSAIKCNWLADICLHLMNQAGGLPFLFAFRYICFFILMGTIWIYAVKIKQEKDVFLFFVLIVVLLSSYGASFLKPEIISMLFFAFIAGIYFSVKSSLWGKWKTKPFLFYPVLFLLWANIHEVFIFGLVLLGLITAGEVLNYLFSKKAAFNKEGFLHLFAGVFLSFISVFINPYGYKLLFKLGRLAAATSDLGIKSVDAYQQSFSKYFYHLHYYDFWVIMAVSFCLFVFILKKNKQELDWGIFLPTLFLAIIFVRYARATFYWPVFWGMSMIYFKKKCGNFNYIRMSLKRIIGFGLVAFFLFFSFRAIYNSRYNPSKNQWLGFGISYVNPVQASSFLKERRPGKLLYNSYDSGGYLLYDLFPLYKVFIDPRYFPYKNWFPEYYDFHSGKISIEKFRGKYPFDVALLDYSSSPGIIKNFTLSKEWSPVFYGPAAIIFLKKDAIYGNYNLSNLDKNRFNNLHTLHQAYTVFVAAQNVGDLETSRYILSLIKKKFSFHNRYKDIIKVCTLYQDGLEFMVAGDYENAFIRLNILGFSFSHSPYKFKANNALLALRNWKTKQLVQKKKFTNAIILCKATLEMIPDNTTTLYNAGIIGYMIETQKKTETDNSTNWRSYLEQFLKLAPDHPCAKIAKQVIAGQGLPKEVPMAY